MKFSLRNTLIGIAIFAFCLAFTINAIEKATRSYVTFSKLRVDDSTAIICYDINSEVPPNPQSANFSTMDHEIEFDSKGFCNYELVTLPEGESPVASTANFADKLYRSLAHRIPHYASHSYDEFLFSSAQFEFRVDPKMEQMVDLSQPLPILDFVQLSYTEHINNRLETAELKCTVWLVPIFY